MAAPLAERAEMRAATPADLVDVARIMNYPPDRQWPRSSDPPAPAALALLARNGASIALAHTTVAVVDGAVAGVLECGIQYGVGLSMGRLLRLLPRILFILGPVTPRAVYGTWLRQKVQFAPQPDAYPIGELYVDEALRNRGIGGGLLQYAEDLAHGCRSSRMCLETGITNPARRLYERDGYVVVGTKTNAGYERITGSPGRILMSKDI